MGPEEIIIPVVAITSICITLFGLYYLRNKENMALIERGINPRSASPDEPRRFSALKYGLMFVGGGLGLAVAFLVERALAKVSIEKYPEELANGQVFERTITRTEDFPQLYFAFIILGAGLGLVTAYLLLRNATKDR